MLNCLAIIEEVNMYLDILQNYGNANVPWILMAKVLCKPHLQKPNLLRGNCETGKFNSARMGPHSRFQKYIHDWLAPRHRPIMSTLLKFGIGADSNTFGLPRFATPRYQMGLFKMGFAENLGQ